MNNCSKYSNIAFISYKHEDEKWAKWLQNKLQYYKLPTKIRKQNPELEFKDSPRHVFKDTTDLSGGVLAKAIREGLESSKYLVVICSPRAAKSHWVCKEVQEFIDSKREEYIIPFIIDGEPNSKDPDKECFPSALKALSGEKELLGINVNENGRDAAAVKVVARMFGLTFDSLWDRFQKEARRRRISIIAGLAALVIIAVAVAVHTAWQNSELEKRNVHIERQNSKIRRQNIALEAKSDSISTAYDSIYLQQSLLQKAYSDLETSSENLRIERNRALQANQTILRNRSIEYGRLAYNYIEQGNLAEAELLLSKIIPDGNNPYVYTPEMEKALRRFVNYKEFPGIKLVESKEVVGGIFDDYSYANLYSFLSKYGYHPTSRDLFWDANEWETAVTDLNDDTLYLIPDSFDFNFIEDDGHLFIGVKGDTMSIWNTDNGKCLVKKYLEDGFFDLKHLSDKRIVVRGNEYFSIFHYGESELRVESKTQILGEIKSSKWVIKFPFVYDEKNKWIVYQIEDSSLIVQEVGSIHVVGSNKIGGVVDCLSLGNAYGSHSYMACTYGNIPGLGGDYVIGKQHFRVLDYPSLSGLYDQDMGLSRVFMMGFLPKGYLYAVYDKLKDGVFSVYVYDTSVPYKYGGNMYNIDSSFVINRELAEKTYGRVLCFTKDRKLVYENGWDYILHQLCVRDLVSGETDTLSSSNRSFAFQDSYDGKYIVFADDKGVYVYDKRRRAKTIIESSPDVSDVCISSDGNVICYNRQGFFTIHNLVTDNTKKFYANVMFETPLSLNHNGTRLLYLDKHHTLYEYDIRSKKTRLVTAGGSECFGFSEHDNYIYQVYCRGNEGESQKPFIKVWNSKTLDLIMDNELDYYNKWFPKVFNGLIFDEYNNFIYGYSYNQTFKIPFLPLGSLVDLW